MKNIYLYIVVAACIVVYAKALADQHQNLVLEADEYFLCSAEYSTGYELKNSRWIRERFIPSDKYKVAVQDEDNWTVYSFTDDYEYTDCELASDGILQCNIEAEFTMNFETLKFSVTSTSSYVHSKRRNRDPVVLMLGTCVKI